MIVLGIDPGVSGGMALVETVYGTSIVKSAVSFTNKPEKEIIRELNALTAFAFSVCYIEKVGYIRGDGAQGSFTFGRAYGFVRGMALSNGLIVRDAYPAVWQSSMGCMTRGNKNVSKKKAIQLFAAWDRQCGITHATADAILIAEYGRRLEERR